MRRLLLRLGLAAGGVLLAAALLEGGLRATGQGVRAQLGLFEQRADGAIGLQPCGSDRVRGPDGRVTHAYTDAASRRARRTCEADGAGVLLLGDSQVFGLGVEADESFAAALGAVNAGVPDYGVPDALAAGRAALAAPDAPGTVVLVVNQANDWEDGLASSAARNEVRRGYLFRRERLATPGAWIWATPLADSALVYRLWARLAPPLREPPPAWLTAPDAQAPLSAALGAAITTFAAEHPATRVLVAWLPADLATGEARAGQSVLARGADPAPLRPWADTRLRDQLAAALAPRPLLDLGPALGEPEHFLPHDFHLSARGHAAVADALRSALASPP